MATARSPKRAVCQLQHVAVRGREYGKEMGFGTEVDLHELVAPGLTLEQALGEHVHAFTLIHPPRRRDTSTDAV